MSQKLSVRVLNPDGSRGWMAPKKAKDFVNRGRARWIADNLLQFILEDPLPLPVSPPVPVARAMQRARLVVTEHIGLPWIKDLSGGMARYPLPDQGCGPNFPALARIGAGLL